MNKRKRNKTKQRSMIYCSENYRSSNTNPTKNRVWIQVARKGKQFLLHYWHQSSYSCDKLGKSQDFKQS